MLPSPRQLCLGLALLVGILPVCDQASTAEPLLRYTSPTCGVEFRLPADWSVVVAAPEIDFGESNPFCSLQVQPKNRQKLAAETDGSDFSTISLRVFAKNFDVQLLRDGYFRRDHGEWKVVGRLESEAPAEEIKGHGWWGVEGTAALGCFDSQGNAGLCDAPRALIGNDGNRSTLIVGGSQSEAVVKTILKTFRFR
jgi:hypothetical protein